MVHLVIYGLIKIQMKVLEILPSKICNLNQVNFVRSKTLQTSTRKHTHTKKKMGLRVNDIKFYSNQMMMFLILPWEFKPQDFKSQGKQFFWIMDHVFNFWKLHFVFPWPRSHKPATYNALREQFKMADNRKLMAAKQSFFYISQVKTKELLS